MIPRWLCKHRLEPIGEPKDGFTWYRCSSCGVETFGLEFSGKDLGDPMNIMGASADLYIDDVGDDLDPLPITHFG